MALINEAQAADRVGAFTRAGPAEIIKFPVARSNEPIEPMTLGNMRENGVRSLFVSCWQCHHQAVMSGYEALGAFVRRIGYC
jgi:hypothetical protein